MKKLEPCPFCGSDKLRVDMNMEKVTGRITCNGCSIITEFLVRTADDMAMLWNRRAPFLYKEKYVEELLYKVDLAKLVIKALKESGGSDGDVR